MDSEMMNPFPKQSNFIVETVEKRTSKFAAENKALRESLKDCQDEIRKCYDEIIPDLRKQLNAYRALGTPDEIAAMQAELKKLRDDEAAGLIIRLPRKVGDAVYWNAVYSGGIISGEVTSIKTSKFGFDLEIAFLGMIIRREFEKVFLTREEAEAALNKEAP